MSSIWLSGSLADLFEDVPRNGYSPKAVEHETPVKSLTLTATTSGRFRGEYFKYIAEEIPPDSHLWLQAGDILIQRANTIEKVGVSALFEGPSQTFIYPDLMMKVRANSKVLPVFLHYLLLSEPVRSYFRENATGTAGNMPKINQKTVLAAPASWPSLEEQRRIVDKLGVLLAQVDACRERLDRVSAIVKRFRQAVLAAATSGRLTEDWRARNRGPNWTTESAAAICEKVQSGGTPRSGFIGHPGVPFIKVYNIVNQKVDFEGRPQFVERLVHEKELGKSRVLPGDVLMNIVGPPLGKVAVVPDTFPEWNINQAIALFRPGPRITSKWLYFLLCGGANVAAIANETRGMVGQVNISISQCRNFEFPVPALAEQEEIVRRVELLFSHADRLEARIQETRARVERLTPALLAKAFRGELVPQDPNDESAEVLLERLRQSQSEPEKQRRPGEGRPVGNNPVTVP